MSQGYACRDRDHRHVVTVRNANYSRFNGGRWTPSDYSEIRCLATGAFWRSKAALVDTLPDAQGDEAHRAIDRGDLPLPGQGIVGGSRFDR